MTTLQLVLALVGLVLGVVVLLIVASLLQRVLRPVHEIGRYADDILVAGLGTATNLDGLDAVARTRELAAALAGEGGATR